MVGLNKFTDKERRAFRRSFQSDPYKDDLRTPKYRERSIPDKKRRFEKTWSEEIGDDE